MVTLMPGETCGGCYIVRVLGEGSQGCVYEVRTPEGERCAMKVVEPGACLAARAAERLGVEGESLSSIDHINVLRFYRAGVDGTRVWLLVELIEGESLGAKLRRRPPLTDIVRWIVQAGEGVSAAHDQGIVHRDLKPENILIAAGNVVKVIDFGFAKLAHLGIQTTDGTLIGTKLYMAPEQLRNLPPSTSWDVFALGLVLYEAIAGKHPLEAASTNPVAVLQRHLDFRPPPLAQAAPGVHADLADIVDRAVHPHFARRPPMRELVRELREALHLLLAPRRASARNLPLPNRDPQAARTVPLPVSAPPASSARPSTATQPLAAWEAERAAGDRPAQPPPPSTAPVATAPARASASGTMMLDGGMLPPVAVDPVTGRPSATSGHDVSAAPVEAAMRASRGSAPGGKRGPAAFVGAAVLLAAAGTGAWVWHGVAADPSERASGAAAGEPLPPAASDATAPSASAPDASASAAPSRPGGQAPARRRKGR